jgi:tRNA pseudouridine32 synthase
MAEQYIVQGRVRHVKPYIFSFKTFAKGRWLGKNILDVLSKEFGGYDISYWTEAIRNQNVLVNNRAVTEDYIVKNSDQLLHQTHRHEPPVSGSIIKVGETCDILAVCKPASLPSK